MVAQGRQELAQLRASLLDGKLEYEPDPEAIARDIARRILEAEDPSEVARMGTAVHAEQLMGVPLVVRSFRANPSGFENGPRFYLVLDAIREDTGEQVAVTCGSVNAMAFFIRAMEKGWLPARGHLREADKPSSSGFYPQWWVPEAVGVDATD